MQKQNNFFNQRGYTFIEILIVIAIIGILAAAGAFSYLEMIKRGRVARAQGDLSMLAKGIRQLELDTAKHPGNVGIEDCVATSGDPLYYRRFALDGAASTGLMTNPSNIYSNWTGPYVEYIPDDPWGNSYYFRTDYECNSRTKGCERFSDGTRVRAIFSGGENESTIDASDTDDVVAVICYDTV